MTRHQALVGAPNQATFAAVGAQKMIALATLPTAPVPFQQDISSVASWSRKTAVATLALPKGLPKLARAWDGTAKSPPGFSDATANVGSSSAVINVGVGNVSGISVVPGSAKVAFGGDNNYSRPVNFSDGSSRMCP